MAEPISYWKPLRHPIFSNHYDYNSKGQIRSRDVIYQGKGGSKRIKKGKILKIPQSGNLILSRTLDNKKVTRTLVVDKLLHTDHYYELEKKVKKDDNDGWLTLSKNSRIKRATVRVKNVPLSRISELNLT